MKTRPEKTFGLILVLAVTPALYPAEKTIATSLYARVAPGYVRERLKDGSFKPEYYALSNGGRLDGTTGDNTVERVGYPDVAALAQSVLTRQNYHYARNKEEATLLLVLNWGNTISFDRVGYEQLVNEIASGRGSGIGLDLANQQRDQINEDNARVLGYMDELAEWSIFRGTGGPGEDRYKDLIGDVEVIRYYIMISAYDFQALSRQGRRQLLWQVRVSVPSPGNNFGGSLAPMLLSASKYFGRDSGKLVMMEESTGTVELGDLEFLGEAKETDRNSTKEKK